MKVKILSIVIIPLMFISCNNDTKSTSSSFLNDGNKTTIVNSDGLLDTRYIEILLVGKENDKLSA